MLKFCLIFLKIVLISGQKLPRQESELQKGVYNLGWEVDFSERKITFDLKVKTEGWIGLGINLSKGGMGGSDFFVGGVYKNGTAYFDDYYGTGNTKPTKDNQNDWNLIESSETDGETSLKFWRFLNTCDDQDVEFINGTQTLLWAYGESDEFEYHNSNKGSRPFYFLDYPPLKVNTGLLLRWEVRVDTPLPTNPAKDTTYWCTFHKSPRFRGQNYIVGFEPYLPSPASLKHMHHFVLTRCIGDDVPGLVEPILQNYPEGFDCEDYLTNATFLHVLKSCREYHIYAWGIGAPPLYLPENMGYPIDTNIENEYIMLEIHYDNYHLVENVKFETGVDILYTREKREIEASLLYIESTFISTHFIPPGEPGFTVPAHCDPKCTDHLPETGINFFVAALHSHKSGAQMRIRHFRNDTELPWIVYDDNYDFDFQQSRKLPKEVNFLPGDQMTIECVYDTSERTNITLFGIDSRSEMCMSFLWFYPKVELASCSSKPDMTQWAFFEHLGIEKLKNETDSENLYDPDIILPEKWSNYSYSEIVNTKTNWTIELRDYLQDFFRYGNHIGKCYRIPEEYEEVPTRYPKLNSIYEKPKSDCPNPIELESTTSITNSAKLPIIGSTILSFCAIISILIHF